MIKQKIQRKAIIVLGCHRSGTSVLTKIISIVGASLPKNLLGANESNESGHWESQDVINLNDEILAYFKISWSDIAIINKTENDDDFLNSKIPDMIKILEDNFENSSLFVLKDPRMVNLFKFWKPAFTHLKIKTLFVHTTRNPLEVAQSLNHRNGIEIEKGLQFWLKETLQAEKQSRGKTRSFVSYEALLNDPLAVIAKIGTELDMNWENLNEALMEEIRGFIRIDLHHHDVNSFDRNNINAIYKEVSEAFLSKKEILIKNVSDKYWCLIENNIDIFKSASITEAEVVPILCHFILDETRTLTEGQMRALPKDFDSRLYLLYNQDLVLHRVNPYQHYIDHGASENRRYR